MRQEVGLRRGEELSEQGRVTKPIGDHRPDLLGQVQVLWVPADHSPQTRVWGSEEGPEAALHHLLRDPLLLSSPSFLLTAVLQLSSLGGGQKTSEGARPRAEPLPVGRRRERLDAGMAGRVAPGLLWSLRSRCS